MEDERSLIQNIAGVTNYLVHALLLANRAMPYDHLIKQAFKQVDDACVDLKRIYDLKIYQRERTSLREEKEREDRAELLRQIDDLKQQLLERQ